MRKALSLAILALCALVSYWTWAALALAVAGLALSLVLFRPDTRSWAILATIWAIVATGLLATGAGDSIMATARLVLHLSRDQAQVVYADVTETAPIMTGWLWAAYTPFAVVVPLLVAVVGIWAYERRDPAGIVLCVMTSALMMLSIWNGRFSHMAAGVFAVTLGVGLAQVTKRRHHEA